MDDENLIICVQNRPSIYNKKDPLHYNRDYNQKMWEAIAHEMKSEVNAVKSRWGHIRDYFLKKQREYKNVKSGQAATPGKKKWHLYDALAFLIPVYEPRETCSNLSRDDEADETVQATDFLDTYSQASSQASSPMSNRPDCPSPQPSSVPCKRPQKRKNTSTTASEVDAEILKSLQQPEVGNDDEMWARSLIPSLQRLNYLEKLEFRLEVQGILLRYLRRQEDEARGSYGNHRQPQGASNYSTTEDEASGSYGNPSLYQQWTG